MEPPLFFAATLVKYSLVFLPFKQPLERALNHAITFCCCYDTYETARKQQPLLLTKYAIEKPKGMRPTKDVAT